MNEIDTMHTHTNFGLKDVLLLILCILIPEAVGALSGYLTIGEIEHFKELNMPVFTPPAVVFPVVWMILYVVMGVGLYLALRGCTSPYQRIYVIFPFVIQLILNFGWSIIFFNVRSYIMAFICLMLLLIMIIRTIFFWVKFSRISVYLMSIYVMWVLFAGYLNLGVIVLN